jgi:HD-GYP domain-containing protein (c-di-GMP phosphodiesterase class II)
MTRRRYLLDTFVRRVLPLRLLAAGVTIALVFAGLAFYRGYERIGAEVVESARTEVEGMKARVRQILDQTGQPVGLRAAVQQALAEQQAHPAERRYGRFVYARFYDLGGQVPAEQARPADAESGPLTAQIQASSPRFPAASEHAVERLGMIGRPFLHLTVPMHDLTGATTAYAEGLFRLSDAAVGQVRADALKAALHVALIVLATIALLYPVAQTLVGRLGRYSEDLLASNLDTLEALGSAIAKRDSDTDAHNYRVTLYSLRLAEAAGLEAERVRTLIKGAFLHDVGKIGIRGHILHKPARLDPDEFRIMQTHVDHGLDIVRRSRWLTDPQAVVGGHHEKYDGSGYPRGIAGESIPIEARIFAIADVLDALTSRRPIQGGAVVRGDDEDPRSRSRDPLRSASARPVRRELRGLCTTATPVGTTTGCAGSCAPSWTGSSSPRSGLAGYCVCCGSEPQHRTLRSPGCSSKSAARTGDVTTMSAAVLSVDGASLDPTTAMPDRTAGNSRIHPFTLSSVTSFSQAPVDSNWVRFWSVVSAMFRSARFVR